MLGAVIDDHKMIAEAIRNSLLLQNIASEIDIYYNADFFFKNVRKDNFPKFIITDLLMPGNSGVEILNRYRNFISEHSIDNDTKLLVLSTISDPLTVKMAIRSGANAYLSKESTLEELVDAIHNCLENKNYIGQNLRESVINNFFSGEQIIFHLSPREKEVLQYICSGKTIKETAFEINLSVHTVKGYYKSIMKKFNVNRTPDLIVFAMKNGFYNPNKSF